MASRLALPIPFGWFGLVFSDDVAPGQVKAISAFGKELVIFRTESGEAKVIDAYCPHLGAHLGHGGKVHGESIACPFHGWQFNGAGQCTAVPYAKNMPPKVAGGKPAIFSYPTVERNRVIWAWYHPQQAEPSYDVIEIPEFADPEWGEIERFEWTFQTAVQEAAENSVDAAHFIFVHGTSEMPSGQSVFDGTTRTSVYSMKVPRLADDGTIDPLGGEVHLETISNGSGMGLQRFTGAVDIVMMAFPLPIEADRLRLCFAFITPKQQEPFQQLMAQAAKAEVSSQVEADIPIWEHKVYLASPTLCDGDGSIHQFRKWFKQFYAEAPVKQGALSSVK